MKSESIPLEVKFGKESITFFLHPDGAIVGDSIALHFKVEAMQRAGKRLGKIDRELNAGTIDDDDEYNERLAALTKSKDEALAAGTLAADVIEKQYREACRDLEEARHGTPPTLERTRELQAEADGWREMANIRPVAVPFLRSCVLDWTYYADDSAAARDERLPVTHDTLNLLSEDQLKIAFAAVSEFYRKREAEEKKPTANSIDTSPTPKQEPEQSPTGLQSIESPAPTGLTPTMLANGESAS